MTRVGKRDGRTDGPPWPGHVMQKTCGGRGVGRIGTGHAASVGLCIGASMRCASFVLGFQSTPYQWSDPAAPHEASRAATAGCQRGCRYACARHPTTDGALVYGRRSG